MAYPKECIANGGISGIYHRTVGDIFFGQGTFLLQTAGCSICPEPIHTKLWPLGLSEQPGQQLLHSGSPAVPENQYPACRRGRGDVSGPRWWPAQSYPDVVPHSLKGENEGSVCTEFKFVRKLKHLCSIGSPRALRVLFLIIWFLSTNLCIRNKDHVKQNKTNNYGTMT